MFYQSAADSELLRVAGPGDVALSNDKQADKNSRRHRLSVSEAPLEEGWRRRDDKQKQLQSSTSSPEVLF